MKNIRLFWEKWKQVTEKIGNFQATIIFSLLYFLIITPVSFVANLFADYFKMKEFPKWQEYEIKTNSLKRMKEQ